MTNDQTTTQTIKSSNWIHDENQLWCTRCADTFNAINRRHHCRLCGKIFCSECASKKAMIPPSSLVIHPGQLPSHLRHKHHPHSEHISFSPDEDPEGLQTVVKAGEDSSEGSPNQNNSPTLAAKLASVPESGGGLPNLQLNMEQQEQRGMSVSLDSTNTFDTASFYVDRDDDVFQNVGAVYKGSNTNMVHGKTVELRYKMARDPQRVCDDCFNRLENLQPTLRSANANCHRYNCVDPTDVIRHFNSPLAFTLGHEIRKAAYTINNLLPQPKRTGIMFTPPRNEWPSSSSDELCQVPGIDSCSTLSPNLSNLDGLNIPGKLLEEAKGVAFLTVLKVGAGVAVEYGTGLVVSRLDTDRRWSAPSAIALAGVSWGAQVGAQLSDHMFLLMTDAAVSLMFSGGSVTLGADIAVSVGPVGRAFEATIGKSTDRDIIAPIYTYSLSKGLFIGASLDGKVIHTRKDINEKFYGRQVSSEELRVGEVSQPQAGQPLYDALKRLHVYASQRGGIKSHCEKTTFIHQLQRHGVADDDLSTLHSHGEQGEDFLLPQQPSSSVWPH